MSRFEVHSHDHYNLTSLLDKNFLDYSYENDNLKRQGEKQNGSKI